MRGWAARAYAGWAAGDAVPLQASLAFDLAVTSVLVPLVCGARVAVSGCGPGWRGWPGWRLPGAGSVS